jgi:hypothetical protein
MLVMRLYGACENAKICESLPGAVGQRHDYADVVVCRLTILADRPLTAAIKDCRYGQVTVIILFLMRSP